MVSIVPIEGGGGGVAGRRQRSLRPVALATKPCSFLKTGLKSLFFARFTIRFLHFQ